MGQGPTVRRSPAQSIGAIGSTTVSDRATGGGHDELIRRLMGQGGTPSRPRVSLELPDLGDVGFVYESDDEKPTDGDVLMYVADEDSPYGGWWMPMPPDSGGGELLTLTATGSFDETGGWTYQPVVNVPANTRMLVVVDVVVAISDIGYSLLSSDGVSTVAATLPTPWRMYAQDPGGVTAHSNGTGSCGASVPLWLQNDTDDVAPHTLTVVVEGFWNLGYGATTYDATVTAAVHFLNTP